MTLSLHPTSSPANSSYHIDIIFNLRTTYSLDDRAELSLVVHYSISCSNCFITHRTGLGAAWPSPHMDASAIALESSCNNGLSHLGDSMSLTALPVPTRHGVHLPHDSSAKNFIRLRAAALALSRSER